MIQELNDNDSNSVTGNVPWGIFSHVAREFKPSAKYGNDTSNKVHIPQKCDIKKEDQNLPNLAKSNELLKRETPSMSGQELQDKLKKYSPVCTDVSVSTVNRSVSRGLSFTYKRIKRPYSKRFTHANMLYSQAYKDFCQTKQTHQKVV